MRQVHYEMKRAIEKDKLVFFVGSGFSLSLGFPNWRGLLNEVLTTLSVDNEECNLYNKLLDMGKMNEIQILNLIYAHKLRIFEIMDQLFQLDESKVAMLDNHKKLGQITSKIITTNYDKALERVNPQLTRIVYGNDYRVAKLPDTDKYIFKLHGCIENPANCVLFEEDYKKLYDQPAPAIEELKKIIADQTIIFLGFSLADPYVKHQFEYINKLYSGLKGNHFLVTAGEQSQPLDNIKLVELNDWTDLDGFLHQLIEIKKALLEVSSAVPKLELNIPIESVKQTEVKIAILIASPIDKDFDYDFEKISKCFNNFQVTVYLFYLTVENLNNLDGYDYIFIFTNTVKNRVFIEDEFLKSKPMTIQEIGDEIPVESTNAVFFLLDKETDIDGASLPTIIKVYSNENLRKLIFEVIKKGNLDSLKECLVFNKEIINLTRIINGRSSVQATKSELSNHIDPKNLINFVGRTTDLEAIIRKIIDSNGQILTIKGSGGIGKTTLVKKAAVEFSERNLFADGIHFIACEFIDDYQTFAYKVAQCYDLDSSIDFIRHIRQNKLEFDNLIILDNFESLLYVKETSDIKNLVSTVCDYSTVVVTSRERIGFEFEDVYDLRPFTTDEAVELFQKHYSYKISESEYKILRVDILENLLNNNPLAIKIITANLPKAKNMLALKVDLETDFFNTTNIEIDDIFDRETDENIERSKSLFNSINYSYSKLHNKDKERLAFEILSLFPDGIYMQDFKIFFEDEEFKRDVFKITDKEIKSLENKSLIEISNGFIKLQSIVGRFAEYQLNKRNEEEKALYYKRAFQYNYYLLSMLLDSGEPYSSKTLRIFDMNSENILKCLDYIDKFDFNMKDKIIYISRALEYFNRIDQRNKFLFKLKQVKNHFKSVNNDEKLLFLEVIICYLGYFEGYFSDSYSRLNLLLPLEKLESLNGNDYTESEIIDMAIDMVLSINNMEGKSYDAMKYLINNNNYYFNIGYLMGVLFYFGEYDICNSIDNLWHRFFSFEIELNLGILDVSNLDNYINSLYKKEFLEILQNHYIKSKLGKIDEKTINKLVETNPYTIGLKKLMLAFLAKDTEKVIQLYEEAIEHLAHIKYYYVEAIYYYTKYLKEINSEHYQMWFDRGNEMAKKYYYRFLIHQFYCLAEGINEKYDEDKYELPLKAEIKEYVRKYKEYHRNKKK